MAARMEQVFIAGRAAVTDAVLLVDEYGADAHFIPLNYTFSRWFESKDRKAMDDFLSYYHAHIVYDVRVYPLILFKTEWEMDYIQGKSPQVQC